MNILICGANGFIAQAGLASVASGLPDFLWHPFGPVLKNLPILAVLFILLNEETQP
jgi:hypothetical protein